MKSLKQYYDRQSSNISSIIADVPLRRLTFAQRLRASADNDPSGTALPWRVYNSMTDKRSSMEESLSLRQKHL